MVDLRSDTTTRPTPEMRAAMVEAEVGTDVYGEDPTVNRLQARVAEITGKEAALFVPSGTMANSVAIACWTRPGDALIADEDAHILLYETGNAALVSGVTTLSVRSRHGVPAPHDFRRKITKESLTTPGTRLMCLENTHNRGGGTVIPADMMGAYREVADEAAIPIHLDGARIWNASVASGRSVRELCQAVDSVSVCLSKGLGAPVGSVLCGPAEFIGRATRWRKRLGGAMCQSGILAAAGLYALEHNIDRLADDHRRARQLWTALFELPGLRSAGPVPQTNIVLLDTDVPAERWQNALAERGVAVFPFGPKRLRLVTHLDVTDEDVARAVSAFSEIASSTSMG